MDPAIRFFQNNLDDSLSLYFEELILFLEQRYFDDVLTSLDEMMPFSETKTKGKDKLDVNAILHLDEGEEPYKYVHIFNSREFEVVATWATELTDKVKKMKTDSHFLDWIRNKNSSELFEMCFPFFFRCDISTTFDRPMMSLYYVLSINQKPNKIVQSTLFADEGWRIKDIEVLNLCFPSHNGNIYNAKHKVSSKTCTVKILIKHSFLTEKENDLIDHELKLSMLFREIKSPNLLTSFMCEQYEGENFKMYLLVMEPLKYTLSQIITIPILKNQNISEKNLYAVFLNLMKGIVNIHEQSYNLKDLDFRDVYITEDNRIILGNLRNIKKMSNSYENSVERSYMPPEVISNDSDIDPKKADAWLLAILIIRVIATKSTKNADSKTFCNMLHESRLRKNYNTLLTIFERILVENPSKRETLQIYLKSNPNLKTDVNIEDKFEIESNQLLNLEAMGFYYFLLADFKKSINYFKKLYQYTQDKRYFFVLGVIKILQEEYDVGCQLIASILTEMKHGFDFLMFWEIILWILSCEKSPASNQEFCSIFQLMIRKCEVLAFPIRMWSNSLYFFYSKFLLKINQELKGLEYASKLNMNINKGFPKCHLLASQNKITLCELYYQNNDLERAVDYIEDSLRTILQLENPNRLLLVTCFKTAGKVYRGKKEFKNGIAYYSKAYTVLENQYTQNSEDCMEIYVELARLFKLAKDFTNSINYFQAAIEISRKIYGDTFPGLAEHYISIAKVKYELQQYQDVAALLAKAEKLLSGENDPKYVRLLCDLNVLMGKTFKKQKNYKVSLEHLNEAWMLVEKHNIHNDGVLIELYDTRGMIFRKICDNFQALSDFDKGYALVKIIQKNNTYQIIKYLRHLAQIHQILENYDRSKEFFIKALDLLKQSNKEPNAKAANCNLNLGIICQKQGKYLLAKEYFERALDHESALNIDENLNSALIKIHLGKTLGLNHEIKNGNSVLDSAFNQLKRLEKAESIHGVRCLYEKGVLYEIYGDKKRAKEIFTQSYSLAKKISSKEDCGNILLELEAKLQNTFIA